MLRKRIQIDEEISRVMEEAHQRVQKILSEKRSMLDELAAISSVQERALGDDLTGIKF